MPKPRPLTPQEAKRTLAHRLAGRVDRARQVATRLGLRSTRVFLVHTRWTGGERGEGREMVRLEHELLPTPKVESIDAINLRLWAMGTVPEGSVRLTGVSATYTRDILMGRALPVASQEPLNPYDPCIPVGAALVPATPHTVHIREPEDFFYELVEDGRGDDPPARMKFRLAQEPGRREGTVDWTVLLERVSEDRNRDGSSAIDVDDD